MIHMAFLIYRPGVEDTNFLQVLQGDLPMVGKMKLLWVARLIGRPAIRIAMGILGLMTLRLALDGSRLRAAC